MVINNFSLGVGLMISSKEMVSTADCLDTNGSTDAHTQSTRVNSIV